MPGQRFLDCLDAKVGLQRDRHPPGKDTAGEPVDDSRKIDEATRHRDVGDVHRPDLIGPNDWQVAQKVGVDFVPGGRFRGVGHPIQCPKALRLEGGPGQNYRGGYTRAPSVGINPLALEQYRSILDQLKLVVEVGDKKLALLIQNSEMATALEKRIYSRITERQRTS